MVAAVERGIGARRSLHERINRESDSPSDVLHDDEELAIGGDDVERGHDVFGNDPLAAVVEASDD
jgi:hypothetical protein